MCVKIAADRAGGLRRYFESMRAAGSLLETPLPRHVPSKHSRLVSMEPNAGEVISLGAFLLLFTLG